MAPDKDKLGYVVDAGATEADEFLEREVVGDGNDEEESGSGARVRKRWMRFAPKQVRFASPLVEFGTRVRAWKSHRSLCGMEFDIFKVERVVVVHWVDSKEEHGDWIDPASESDLGAGGVQGVKIRNCFQNTVSGPAWRAYAFLSRAPTKPRSKIFLF